jgi:hypothetical protein
VLLRCTMNTFGSAPRRGADALRTALLRLLTAKHHDGHGVIGILAVGVALLTAGQLHVGLRAAFLPCTLDCGETYEGHIGARNLHNFGLRYASGLEDLAAGPDSAAHPTLYIHNPNVGMYFLYLLFLLGVHDVHAQAALVTVPFGAGLLYLYLSIRAFTRSVTMAALALLTSGTLYLLVGLWGFHSLRGFSWLLTFGPLYHVNRYARRGRARGLHLAAAVGYLGVSFGIDYPFAVFLGTSIVMVGALRLVPLPLGRLILIVVLSLGVPLVLRQIQVISVVGVGLWAMDLSVSVVRRVPLVGLVLGAPDEATLEALYGHLNIVKWPGGGSFTPWRWLTRLVGPYWYVLGTPFLALGGAWSATVLVLRRADVRRAVRRGGRPAVAACYLALALAVGLAGAFFVFADYVSTFYGFVLMPLVVHWIVVLLALVMYLLLAHRRATIRLRGYVVPVGALALAAFIVWRAGTEVRHYALLPPRPYPGRAALREIEGSSAVTLWISRAVSAYTRQWAASLNDGRRTGLRPGDLPFNPDQDYYAFMEADRENPLYRRPDFLFVPALNVAWFGNRGCQPPRGWIATNADGCSELTMVARRLRWLPLYRQGEDFLLYDLRKAYPEGN